MERFDIDCQNDDCGVSFEAQLDNEDYFDGSGHVAKCPNCGVKTYFEVTYVCVADELTFTLDEDL